MTETKLEPKIEALLKENGYTIIRKLGEGHTRDVYEALYKHGSLEKVRVVKIPKEYIDENSITTAINRSKGDLDEREVIALNKVKHPNIIEINDAFKIGDKTITVEEHYEAISLDQLVRFSRIAEPEKFKNIFLQVAAGLEHLHQREGLLHRDIKPSNILIGIHDGSVKLSDLQTAGKIGDITESFLPTRGGTQFTAPQILNALLDKKEAKANIQSEFYALGATMFYSLTGEPLFNTELVSDEHGTSIIVDGKILKATLKQDGKPIGKINIGEHDAVLEKRLKLVSRQYRKMLRNCLSVQHPKYVDHNAHFNFNQDFENAVNKRIIPWQTIKSYAIGYTAVAGIITGIFGGIKLIELQGRQERFKEPAIHETLRTGIYPDGGLDYLLQNSDIAEQFIPYFKQIKEQENPLKEGKKGIFADPLDNTIDMQRMSKRLCYSIMRSALMEDKKLKQEEYKEIRTNSVLVPNDFVNKFNEKTTPDEFRYSFYAILHLKNQLGSNKTLADVSAEYFCDKEELFEARKKANSLNYFKTNKKGQEISGYSEYLSETKRNLINRAIALYHITDNEGAIHYDLLDSNNRPTKGLTDK